MALCPCVRYDAAMSMRALPQPSVTIFEHMSRRARETGAINLGQGFPDLPEPEELIEAARQALVERSNQYPPMRGLAELRSAIAGYYRQQQGIELSVDEVVVTSGATEAIAAAIFALVRPGDEVIIVQPAYDAYRPLVERAGGVARFVNLTPPHWRLPIEDLEAAIGRNTRLIVLNTPNNPTGTLLTRVELEAVGDLCARHDLWVLSDEVWEGMYFGAQPLSALAVANLRERTIKTGSAGKIFSLTGWKVGWAIAAAPLAGALAGQHQFLTFTTATPLQWAVAKGLALPPLWHDTHRARYAAARARLVAGLSEAGFVVLSNDASWFVTIDLPASGIGVHDAEFCERVIDEAGVAVIPVSAFYAERPLTQYARLCFTKADDVLDDAVKRLARFRSEIIRGAGSKIPADQAL
jgi:aspartate/methionine/tyrosine aminotransferase